MKLVRKDHWQGEQIPKLISFLSVKMMSFRGYFPVLGLWLPSPLGGSKCRILLELSTKSMTWNRNSGMHEPIVLASIEPRPKSPKLLSPQVNGMKAALWEPILFILTARFHITQGYCFRFLLSFILHKMLNTFMSIFIPSSECVVFIPALLTVLTALTKCLTNASWLGLWVKSATEGMVAGIPPDHMGKEYYLLGHLITWIQSATHYVTWSHGHRALHAGPLVTWTQSAICWSSASCFHAESEPMECCCLHSEWDFLAQVNLSGIPCIAISMFPWWP